MSQPATPTCLVGSKYFSLCIRETRGDSFPALKGPHRRLATHSPCQRQTKEVFCKEGRHAVSLAGLTCADQSRWHLQSQALGGDRRGFMLSLVDVLQSGVIRLAVNVYFHSGCLVPSVWPWKTQVFVLQTVSLLLVRSKKKKTPKKTQRT